MKLESIFEVCMNANILCCDWDDKETVYIKDVKESEKLLVESLDENQKKLFGSFRWDLIMHLLSVRDVECMDTFLLGFKFGKELQSVEDEENQ